MEPIVVEPTAVPQTKAWIVYCYELAEPYGPYLLAATAIAFVLSNVLLVYGRGPVLRPALMCAVLLPGVVSMFPVALGIIESCNVVIQADEINVEPKNWEWAQPVATSLSSGWFAIVVTTMMAIFVLVGLRFRNARAQDRKVEIR